MKKFFVSALVILLIIQIVRFLLDPVAASCWETTISTNPLIILSGSTPFTCSVVTIIPIIPHKKAKDPLSGGPSPFIVDAIRTVRCFHR